MYPTRALGAEILDALEVGVLADGGRRDQHVDEVIDPRFEKPTLDVLPRLRTEERKLVDIDSRARYCVARLGTVGLQEWATGRGAFLERRSR